MNFKMGAFLLLQPCHCVQDMQHHDDNPTKHTTTHNNPQTFSPKPSQANQERINISSGDSQNKLSIKKGRHNHGQLQDN